MGPKFGYVYDDIYLEHDTGYHVESPNRLRAIRMSLDQAGYWNRVPRIAPRKALFEEAAEVHDPDYIKSIEQSCNSTVTQTSLDLDTVVSRRSYEVAMFAAGGVLEGVDRLLSGEFELFFAFIRPPGHHAEHARSMGFCLFNNVAIAAKYAQSMGAERVFIFDWDVHHGNGTQHILETDPTVFFSSIHQFPHYPGTGTAAEMGVGDGLGYTLNMPVTAGVGNREYMTLIERLVIQAMVKFDPNLILISAGFDAHEDDPLSAINLTDDAYAGFLDLILNASMGVPIGIVLEGGYDLESLPRSITRMFSCLVDDVEPKVSVEGPIDEDTASLIEFIETKHPFFNGSIWTFSSS